MKILSAEFVRSVTHISQIPTQAYPEIAFAGRSNVGKSSLINCLVNRKKLALTSSSPGKTRMINYFSINDQLYFVDLPGYGYAKVPMKERDSWKQLIESYITSSQNLKGIVVIIDSRIGPTEMDFDLLGWLNHLQKRALVVATKTDKLSRSKLLQQLKEYRGKPELSNSGTVIPFSAVTKLGKKEIWNVISSFIKA